MAFTDTTQKNNHLLYLLVCIRALVNNSKTIPFVSYISLAEMNRNNCRQSSYTLVFL